MNYKLLFPTYRNRYLFIKQQLEQLTRPAKALNLGTGEGDYDAMIAGYCDQLVACDINEGDVNYARQLNSDVANLQYSVENALALSFPDNTFDLIISVDVIEHVGQPAQMVAEIQRVLKPGGVALITFPSLDYPFTYDPVNRILSFLHKEKIPQGAYAFGHEYLIDPVEFRSWLAHHKLQTIEEKKLSGYLIALLEAYWTGWIQRIFKANATNVSAQTARSMVLRPSRKEPWLCLLTDGLIWLDRLLFGFFHASVGKGFVFKK
ncbi:MAG: methyltransferase domain-containing protein [Saprospiraceae bacterium]|jgi:ubiquinone/menaquinone biosynthesis C-methylase UbiE|nr:methyltransferase domain-containing protein [Saprospiraceae bacterium]